MRCDNDATARPKFQVSRIALLLVYLLPKPKFSSKRCVFFQRVILLLKINERNGGGTTISGNPKFEKLLVEFLSCRCFISTEITLGTMVYQMFCSPFCIANFFDYVNLMEGAHVFIHLFINQSIIVTTYPSHIFVFCHHSIVVILAWFLSLSVTVIVHTNTHLSIQPNSINMSTAAEIDDEIANFRAVQEQLQQIQSDLQLVLGQLTENEMVQQELNLLDASNTNVYKMVGPVLIKNSLEDAKDTVAKRLEFITSEKKRLEDKAQELESRALAISQNVQRMQGALQQATVAAVQEVRKQAAAGTHN